MDEALFARLFDDAGGSLNNGNPKQIERKEYCSFGQNKIRNMSIASDSAQTLQG